MYTDTPLVKETSRTEAKKEASVEPSYSSRTLGEWMRNCNKVIDAINLLSHAVQSLTS